MDIAKAVKSLSTRRAGFRFHGTRLVVETGVDHTAIVAGLMRGQACFFLQ